MTITHPNYPPRKIIRKSATEWITELVTVGYGHWHTAKCCRNCPYLKISINLVEVCTTHTLSRDYSYQVTAVNEQNESAASLKVVVQNDLTLAGNYNTITWDAVTGANR